MSEMRRLDETYKRIVIAGGGQIGERLAEAIESRYQVKIIEMNPARCRYLSDTLDSTVVLQGSASDRDLLLEENIADADIFLALTNDDEANIMSSLLAKRLGAKKVMTIINNPAYVDLIQGGDIDIAISRNWQPSAPCWPTCGAAISSVCTRCAEARRKPSRRLPTATRSRAR